MRSARVAALVLGCLLILPAGALLLGGAAVSVGYAVGRDSDGFFTAHLDDINSNKVAVTAEDVDLATDPGDTDWLFDRLDLDVRLRVTAASSDTSVFVGIAPESDIDNYLAGVAHDEIADIKKGRPVYRSRNGDGSVAPPAGQTFWDVSAAGVGTQQIDWTPQTGTWAVVVMNADGSPGVAADVEIGAKSGAVLPVGLTILGLGAILTIAAVILILVAAHGSRTTPDGSDAPAGPATTSAQSAHPVRLTADLDPQLSRWMWLVKWVLAIPHFVVLVFLWIAFVVLTGFAGFAIVFTGRYPRRVFDFNVGVLRWTWRVSHYATTGGVGTDRYPPFSLEAEPGEPAGLDIAYPARLSRGLVLVKWWLLAIPHYLIVGLLFGSFTWASFVDTAFTASLTGGGVVSLLVLVAGVTLLFTGTYPPELFGLVIGFNRWLYRVIAYAALMTDVYPPFRLDQGPDEPPPPVPPPADSAPATMIGVGDSSLPTDPTREEALL